jgi:hypothetical protein
LLIDRFEAEVIDDEQIKAQESFHELGKVILQVCGRKFRQELIEAVETDRDELAVGSMACAQVKCVLPVL